MQGEPYEPRVPRGEVAQSLAVLDEVAIELLGHRSANHAPNPHAETIRQVSKRISKGHAKRPAANAATCGSLRLLLERSSHRSCGKCLGKLVTRKHRAKSTSHAFHHFCVNSFRFKNTPK